MGLFFILIAALMPVSCAGTHGSPDSCLLGDGVTGILEFALSPDNPPIPWQLHASPSVIEGVGYTAAECRCRRITFDAQGWDRFSACLALPKGSASRAVTVAVEVDGRQILKQAVRRGDAPATIEVPIAGRRVLTLRQSEPFVYLDPTLIRAGAIPDADGHPTPGMCDRLAYGLRRAVDADPAVRARMAGSRVGVSTFELIGGGSRSVAKNAAEDLHTAMIRSGFALVERGQLDAVLRELKIQDTALVDPATAQKIGRLAGCDVLLLGSISDRRDRLVINARLVETATGRSLAADRLEITRPEIDRTRREPRDERWVVTLRASAVR